MTQPTDVEPWEQFTEDQVLRYLEANPNLVNILKGTASNIIGPSPAGTVSFVEYQVKKLQQSKQKLEKQIHNAIQIAKENERLFLLTQKLCLTLLPLESLAPALEAIKTLLEYAFDAEIVTLFLPESGDSSPCYTVFDDKTLPADLQQILRQGKPLCVTLESTSLSYLFPSQLYTHFASSLILPIGEGGSKGFLAAAPLDREAWHQKKGYHFFLMLTEILEYYIINDTNK